MEFRQPPNLLQLSLHPLGVAVNPLEAVHVGVQNLNNNLDHNHPLTPEKYLSNLINWISAVLILGAGVGMGYNFLQILSHPCQLSIKILCKLKQK